MYTATRLLVCLSFALILFTPISPTFARSVAEKSNPIPNFQKIHNDIFRGGRPGNEGVLYVKGLGVKTIINLESNDTEVEAETRFANSLGIRVLSFPMTGFTRTEEESVNGALAALADPNLRPILVHCAHGKDRSGLVSALFRAEQDGWSPARAYQEMKNLGFHWFMFSLKKYFKDRTGYSGRE